MSLLRTLIASAMLAGMTLAVRPAGAQIGELAGFAETMKREFLNRDLVIIADELEMDTAQRDILEALYEDYRNDFETGLKGMHDSLTGMKDELQGEDPDRILQRIFAPLEDWREQRMRLGRDFKNNIKVILSDRQMEHWPAFERRLRREKELGQGTLSGENVNLLLIIRNLNLSDPIHESIRSLLTEYEIELDRALMSRSKIINSSQTDVIQSLREQDPDKSVRLAEKQIAAHRKVRQVNDMYIEIISAGLPSEIGDKFRDDALERGYPKAYQTTRGQRMYAAALKIAELPDDIHAQIADLRQDLRYELAEHAWRMVESIRDYEPRNEINRVEMYAARKSGERVARITSPVAIEMNRRSETDDRYVHLLRGMLTPEQFESLPGGESWVRGRQARKSGDTGAAAAAARNRGTARKPPADAPVKGAEGVSNR